MVAEALTQHSGARERRDLGALGLGRSVGGSWGLLASQQLGTWTRGPGRGASLACTSHGLMVMVRAQRVQGFRQLGRWGRRSLL